MSLMPKIKRYVKKSGDIMTGFLTFNNKDAYTAILKTRTIEDEDYDVTLGVGANKSARMEVVKDGVVLSSVEARSDGTIYNGKTGKRLIEEVTSIVFGNWHSVLPMRSDNNYLYLMLYGTNHLKEGQYSIANDFKLYCISINDNSVNGDITVPESAVTSIMKRDWGIELYIDRTKITDIKTGNYNGIAIVSSNNLTIKSK